MGIGKMGVEMYVDVDVDGGRLPRRRELFTCGVCLGVQNWASGILQWVCQAGNKRFDGRNLHPL